ncbi:hypothetical protein [Paracoccus yeei]|uniref:hypothetical protein n=1 Tax=Paracoccus yeei TaxID=147645 RepID=UPI003BF910B1
MESLPTYEFQNPVDARGRNALIAHPDGRRIGAHAPNTLLNHEKIGKAHSYLMDVVTSQFESFVESNRDGLHGKALQVQAEKVVAMIKQAQKFAIDETRSHRVNLQMRAREALTPIPEQPNAHVRAEIRANFRAKSQPEQIDMLLSADYNLAASVLELGRDHFSIPADVWKRFEDHAMAVIHVRKTALDASNTLQSTPENITAAGVDITAAMHQAEKAVQNFKSEFAVLDDAETVLQNIVAMQALISGKDASEILQ